MSKKILIGLSCVILVLVVAWVAATPSEKIKVGDTVGPLEVTNIFDARVAIPTPDVKWVHLQFRRFAGCPICNLHLQSFVKRYSEIADAGIREVVVFHSPKESLVAYQGKFPFDVVADPEKVLYAQFGVGTSIFSILDVRAWPAMLKGNSLEDRPKGGAEGGALGLPADFLIGADGRVVASHYGRHAYDQWSVDQLIALAK
jgi:peroxiredoxin